jgi:hypothetical protein
MDDSSAPVRSLHRNVSGAPKNAVKLINGKMKRVKLSLCLIKYYSMKRYVEVEVKFHVLLTSALHESVWSASHRGHFIPGERVPSTHWLGTRVGPRSRLDSIAKRRKSLPLSEIEPSSSIP